MMNAKKELFNRLDYCTCLVKDVSNLLNYTDGKKTPEMEYAYRDLHNLQLVLLDKVAELTRLYLIAKRTDK